MFFPTNGRPSDSRGFVHKKLIGVAGNLLGFVPGGDIIKSGISLVGSALSRGGRVSHQFPGQFGTGNGFQFRSFDDRKNGRCAQQACPPGTKWSSEICACLSPRSPAGRDPRFGFSGEAVMGRFGPAEVPVSRMTETRVCDRGMKLGKDGLCYAKLTNKERLYPRGRRPLLTGGDMRSISRARSAGIRMANAKSDLVAIGMLKPAPTRKRKKKAVPVC